jgi:multiple sugar transport system substrate-binding protein
MKKIITYIILVIIIIFEGCANKSNKVITLQFWAMGAEGEYIQKLVPEFEKKNPGIKVKVQMIPWTAAQEKLITAYASDNAPDVFQLGNTWIPQFAALNAIEELSTYIANSNNIKKENYYEGIWQTNVLDDKVYGIPWYIETRLLFYRPDVLAAVGYNNPPKTWDELLDCSRKIKRYFGQEEKYPIYIPTNEWVPFIVFGLQAGSTLLKENDSYGNFSGKEFRTGFEYLMKYYEENLTPAGISQVPNIYQAFKEKYINMYISGPWNIIEFKKTMKGKDSLNWMTAPMPGYKGEYPGLSLAGGASLVIYKKSKLKKEAWKFIEYLSEAQTQVKFFNYLFDLPAVKSAWEDSSIKSNIYINAFRTQFENVTPTPKIPEWEQIAFSKVQQYAEIASKKGMTIETALKNLDKDVNIILEKRRYILSKFLGR